MFHWLFLAFCCTRFAMPSLCSFRLSLCPCHARVASSVCLSRLTTVHRTRSCNRRGMMISWFFFPLPKREKRATFRELVSRQEATKSHDCNDSHLLHQVKCPRVRVPTFWYSVELPAPIRWSLCKHFNDNSFLGIEILDGFLLHGSLLSTPLAHGVIHRRTERLDEHQMTLYPNLAEDEWPKHSLKPLCDKEHQRLCRPTLPVDSHIF